MKAGAPTETEALEPNSDYAVGKAAASLFCGYVARSRGLHVATLRLYSVYGPWEEPERLIPTLIAQGLQRRLPPLADPETARDFIYVDDVCEAFVRAAASDRAGGAIYNVGTGRQTTLRQAAELARRTFGIEAEPAWGSMADRRWDTDVWVADPRRIAEELGWRPIHAFERGFARTAAWLASSRPLWERYGIRSEEALHAAREIRLPAS